MAIWTIEVSELAKRQLDKFDPQTTRRIENFLHDRLAVLDNPRSLGEALHGSKLGEFWKYRVGDYRIIASIEDLHLVVLVLRVGHRRDVYAR